MNQYTFKILNPQSVKSISDAELLNKLYAIWKEAFNKVLEPKNAKVDPDDFFRQHILFALFSNDEVIGFNLATAFDFHIDNHREHHFIRGLTPDAIETMRSQNLHRVMSLEYSTLMPGWRKHQTTIVWAEVLASMALIYNDTYQVTDAVIGTPRIDVKMDQVCENIGFLTIKDLVVKMDYPCSVIAAPVTKNRRFNNIVTNKIVYELWNNRIDHSGYHETTNTNSFKNIKAA